MLLTEQIIRMDEINKRDKMGSPLNFEWGEDLIDPKSKLDVLDPFMDGNEASLAADETLDFSAVSKPGDLSKPSPVTWDNRKRSLCSIDSQLSETSVLITRRKKKPKGMPKRPLSAYNLFFQSERTKIQEVAQGTGEKIGFEGLGKIIGKKWKELTAVERKMYDKLADKDTQRYRAEMETYNDLKTKKIEEQERIASSAPLVETSFDQENFQRSFDGDTFSRQPSSTTEQMLVVAAPAQGLAISSHEEFSRIHAMTAPEASATFSGPPRQQQVERAPVDGMSSIAYHSQYDSGIQRIATSHGAQQMSVPSPPQGAERVPTPSSFHMPPGMEIVLSDRTGQDRKYKVKYTCYSMSRDAARKYIESMGAEQSKERRSQMPSSWQQPQYMEMNGGVVTRGPQGSYYQPPTSGWVNFDSC